MQNILALALPLGVSALNASMSAQQATAIFSAIHSEGDFKLTAEERDIHLDNYLKFLPQYPSVEEAFEATLPLMSQHKIQDIASKATFKINVEQVKGKLRRDATALLGALRHDNDIEVSVDPMVSEEDDFPTNFSSPDHFPQCASIIATARDQGNCGSCWAMAAVEVASDYNCIMSNGTDAVHLSTFRMLSCSNAGSCSGGYTNTAISYAIKNGLPTGGEHGDESTCAPYYFQRCAHHMPESFDKLPECKLSDVHPDDDHYTPPCPSKCTTEGFKTTLQNDTRKFTRAYSDFLSNPKKMKEHLMAYASATAAFDVYEDFFLYAGGVYQRTTSPENTRLGGHAIKLIGWGNDEETGKPYWEFMNSWNEFWGIDGGRFRMAQSDAVRGVYGIKYMGPKPDATERI